MKYNIKAILVMIFSIGMLSLLFYLETKNLDYRAGIEGKVSVHGTYEAIIDMEPIRFTINEDENTYFYFKNNDQLIQTGSFEEEEEFLKLYSGDTQTIYGKIIKSYNKIYFVDSSLSISTYDKLLDVLWIPNSAPLQKEM